MRLKGKLVFKCNELECDNVIEIEADSFEFDITWSDDDRGMGAEIGFEAPVTVLCEKCDKAHSVTYEYTEYPVGALNYQALSSSDSTIEILENTLNLY